MLLADRGRAWAGGGRGGDQGGGEDHCSSSSTTLSCSFGSVRAITAVAFASEALNGWCGIPGGMFPTFYNNNYLILQAPGYVVIVYEMIHDARIIPVDGRPHLSDSVRQWMGN